MRVSGCFRGSLTTAIFLVVLSIQSGAAINNLRVIYQWKFLDYAWPNESTRALFPHYIRENNNPLGIEVAGDRLFITVPRWWPGVAATLNYINLNDTSESPLLNPYPSWKAHEYGPDSLPEVISVYRIRADRCGRLWVLDSALEDLRVKRKQQKPASLNVYNLTNDQIIRKYVIPKEDPRAQDFFTGIAVEDASCEDTFAYLADSGGAALTVYSWRRNDSWAVKHHYFYPDPLGGNFNVSGLSVQWWDAIIGLGLAPRPDGYSTLYFHPLSSTNEFSVDTKLLRDPERASLKSNFHEYKFLGSRGHNGQSASSFIDPITGILFHAVSIGNYIACWKPGTEYNVENVGRVYADNVTLKPGAQTFRVPCSPHLQAPRSFTHSCDWSALRVSNCTLVTISVGEPKRKVCAPGLNLPSDIKIDRQGNIWVVSDRLPIFMYGQLDPDDYNYRVLTGSVQEAIEGTVCSK